MVSDPPIDSDAADQDALVAAMADPGSFPHAADSVRHVETHISHVLLTGDFAYKIKKPLDLGFLDFSTLQKRRFYCEEELRLNRRLAAHIYLGLVPITGTSTQPRVEGTGPVLEYAVKMRRFSQDDLLTRIPVTASLAERIAEKVARFHADVPTAALDSDYGTVAAISGAMLDNFSRIRRSIQDSAELARLEALEDWTRARCDSLRHILEARRQYGHIRECHGDMHRRNIALVDGELVIFDGIEFNPSLRWIDTMSELAFLMMDLEEAGESASAHALLNRYLELSGDYEGLSVLDFYIVYRAMVRAKVTAIRLGQEDVEPDEAAQDREDYGRYIALAERYVKGRPSRLILTHGVSGTGKSTVARRLRERFPVVHLRSDVERKRLCGLGPDARTASGIQAGIYTPDVTDRTYARLLELASHVLAGGYSPLVDATFLQEARRTRFIELAAQKACPCTILDFHAPEGVLRDRVRRRQSEASDPSEADLDVLAEQLASRHPLTDDERALAIAIDTSEPLELDKLASLIA